MHRHEGLYDPRRKGMSSNRAAGIWQEQRSRLSQGIEWGRRRCEEPGLQSAVATCWHQHRADWVGFQNPFPAPEPPEIPDITVSIAKALGGLSRSAARVGKGGTGRKGPSCWRLSCPSTQHQAHVPISNTEQLPRAPRTFHSRPHHTALPSSPRGACTASPTAAARKVSQERTM